MKSKILALLCLSILQLNSSAQFNIRLVITDIATKKMDDIYVAGNFNSWNPKDEQYKVKPFGGNRKGVVIKDIASGNYALKFTRGSFSKVECESDGRDISDRIITLNSDTIIEYTIKGWKDDYPEKPKPYTASPQVKILDTAFNIPQLQRKRRIWVYLPKGYASSPKTYPVMYMHDGQNLFNEQTASFGEWGVDECLDSLQKITGKECIVVGIDHGGEKRLNEYNPYDFDDISDLPKNIINKKGEGKLYVDFLVNTLKPYIDSKFRTKKMNQFTFIAGSSMGGLISLYAITQYPEIFGGAGIFSPSFWIGKNIANDILKLQNKNLIKLYFYAGEKESKSMVTDMDKIISLFSKKSNYTFKEVINPLGQHNEKAWRSEFAEFYKWMLQD